MRYGWADVRPSLERFAYIVDAYTGENIQLLFKRLCDDLYDAVLITANACNNHRILSALRENREGALKHLLESGKGLYIGHQAKIGESASFGFLPDPYDVCVEIRSRATERTTSSNLEIISSERQHPVVTYPEKIDTSLIIQQCLHNKLVTGIYWNHLKPKNPETYSPVLVDSQYQPNRNILLVSRPDLHPRVVISTLVVEWQGHDALWQNIIRYVVEGRPSIAIVAKKGTSSESFSFLTAAIQIKKIGAARYEFDNLNKITTITAGPHDALVLDPAWSADEIIAYNNKCQILSTPGFSRIFYFDQTGQGEVIVNTISRFKDFHRISRSALIWLVAQGGHKDKPYWGGSFWTTVDVLCTLRDFGYPVKQYEALLRVEIEKHDIDGSYDEVVGTTCGLLDVYSLLYGRNDARYKRTLEWIKLHFGDKTLYEQATALDIIVRLGESVDRHILMRFNDEIVSNFRQSPISNEFILQKFICTLLTCDFVETAENLASHLGDLQSKVDGSWINISNTAATTLTLIRLQKKLKQRNAKIDGMIFRGIQFIKSSYSEDKFSWDADPLATAIALKSLKAFEDQMTFPIDELLVSLESVSREARSRIAIDTAMTQNINLQNQLNLLSDASSMEIGHLTDQVQTEKAISNSAIKVNLITVPLVCVIISLMLLLIGYLLAHDKMHNALELLKQFFAEFYLVILPVLALTPLIVLAFHLKRLNRLPKWVEDAIEFLSKLRR